MAKDYLSEERPTAPGWYWFLAPDGDPQAVLVTGRWGDMDTNIQHRQLYIYVAGVAKPTPLDKFAGEWQGPIDWPFRTTGETVSVP